MIGLDHGVYKIFKKRKPMDILKLNITSSCI